MLCEWKQHIFYWEGLGNMIDKFYMMDIPIKCFNFQGHKVILKPFSPKEVHEDQIKIKTKRESEKKEESKTGLNISSCNQNNNVDPYKTKCAS